MKLKGSGGCARLVLTNVAESTTLYVCAVWTQRALMKKENRKTQRSTIGIITVRVTRAYTAASMGMTSIK